jgi:PAS domain S-box-containing protein
MEYRQLTEKSPTSILVVKNNRILYANPAFLHFSGYNTTEITGKDLIFCVDTRDHEAFHTFATHTTDDTSLADRGEFRFITKSGEMRVAILFTMPIPYSGESATLVNLVDISEKQRLEDKIQLDNERRRGIIITVAHELRTPLQPILGYLNLLIQDPKDYGILDDTKKILERCLASVDRERQIINQMLELSVLESGRLRLSYSTFPLATLVNSVLDSSGYFSKADITLDIPDNLIISADMDRLFGVFDSLLSNAVNFSRPPREISIFYRPGINDTCHYISVRDNGIGISESAFSSIFEPFQLADAAKLSRRYDRIGISLSIAKKIMQMHGGDITVESTVKAGSTFTLNLPQDAQNTKKNELISC